jgi:hypothetical protein
MHRRGFAAAVGAAIAAHAALMRTADASRINGMPDYAAKAAIASPWVSCGACSANRRGNTVTLTSHCRAGFGIGAGRRGVLYAYIYQKDYLGPEYECQRTIRLPAAGKTFTASCSITLPDGWRNQN